MIVPWQPVVFVDIFGSILTLALAIWCAIQAWQWTLANREDVFRHYMFLLTLTIVAFAISRSFGHLVKQGLLFYDMKQNWRAIAPFSGAVNSATFIIIFAFGLYFHRLRSVHLEIKRHKNQLEEMVEERTTELTQSNLQLQQTQIQLVTAKEEWERTFDAIGDIVIILDRNFRILRANKATYQAFGTDPAELVNKHCYKIFHDLSAPCEGCPVAPSMTKMTVHTAKMSFEKLGKTLLVTASPVCNEQDELESIILFAKDITAREKLENQLRQSQKMEAIGTLAGGIAHDFNNLLTPIIGFSELNLVLLARDSKARQNEDQVHRAALRAKELVNQILTFSRQTEQEKKPIKLQPLIKEALKLLRSSIPTSIEIRHEIEEDTDPVLAEPSQIHQVLMNLCTNAYHAMREKGGILAVSLKKVTILPQDQSEKLTLAPGDYLRLEVSDTGSGISPEIKERMFEPYFTTKEQGEGTGLGLAVVHGIISGYGGDITTYSEPGIGTTIHVYLPCTEAEIGKESAIEPVEIPHGTEHILVVDDEEQIVFLEQEILEDLGYTVSPFTNSQEAWETYQRQPEQFDLILTDMSMPGLTGLELSQKILARTPGQPIVICTGFSEMLNEENALAMGISHYATKPLQRSDLARIIRQVLDTPSNKKD